MVITGDNWDQANGQAIEALQEVSTFYQLELRSYSGNSRHRGTVAKFAILNIRQGSVFGNGLRSFQCHLHFL